MGIKKGILSKLLLTGNIEKVDLLDKGLGFEWCRSNNSVFNGEDINFEWVIDQLEYHLGEVRRQGSYLVEGAKTWHITVEQTLRASKFNDKAVLDTINKLVWDCVRHELWSDVISILKTRGYKVYEMYYKIASQMLTLVLMVDNGLKWADVEFSPVNLLILTDVPSIYLYDVSISKYGVMNIKRLADKNIRNSVYNIKQTVIKSVYGDIGIRHIHKLTYGNLNYKFIDTDIKKRIMVHLITETGITEQTNWILVNSEANISDKELEVVGNKHYEYSLNKIEM